MTAVRPSTPLGASPVNIFPQRPSHHLSRSVSEVSPPAHRRPHYPHHPHLPWRDKDERPSHPAALLYPRPSFQSEKYDPSSKSEGITPDVSRTGSRRPSLLASEEQAEMAPWQQKRPVREGEVKEEREKSALRATELRQSILDLNSHSNNTTSRLDNTYYSVLERLSVLQSTISTFRELATLTRELNTSFDKEAASLVQDTTLQLEAFDNFQTQERKIAGLQKRISNGRQKAALLGNRVSAVQQKIDHWEKVESEWRMRTRKRLKVLWVIMSVAVFLLLGLLVFQYTPARTQGPGVLRGLNISNLSDLLPELEGKLGNETLKLKRSAEHALESLKKIPEIVEEDPRLRVFDEL